MNKELEHIYFVKNLYINAAKQLMMDNYDYYYNTVNSNETRNLLNSLKASKSSNKQTIIKDYAGCVAEILIKNLASFYLRTDSVFLFMDDMTESNAMAVFSPLHGTVISSTNCTYKPDRIISTDSCYYLLHRRKHQSMYYIDTAFYYYRKSEYIDKQISL